MMQLPKLTGETAVFGLGRSGLACVASLVAAGNQVVAWDDRAEPRQQVIYDALGISDRPGRTEKTIA